MQGFQYFSSLPALHFLQEVLFNKKNNFHAYLICHSLKSGGNKDHLGVYCPLLKGLHMYNMF